MMQGWSGCPIRTAMAVLGVLLALMRPCTVGAQQSCQRGQDEPVRVSEDSIGPLPLFASISSLAASCPSGTDTVFVGPSGRRFPAKVYHFQELSALAVQYRGAVLDSGRSPDGWIVTGWSGVLPGDVPLGSSWSMLWLRYGSAQANNRNVLVVRFCRLPRMLFTMNLDSVSLEPLGEPVDLAAIPRFATIHHLLIVSPELGRAFERC